MLDISGARWLPDDPSFEASYRLLFSRDPANAVTQMPSWRDLRLIPHRVLPPQSLIVALTPLLDWRVNRALLNLRARGYDLALIEVDPLRFAEHARATYGEQAWRVWLLERELLRNQFQRAGVPVSRWNGHAPLAAAVEELASTR